MHEIKRFESVSAMARFINNTQTSKRNPYYDVEHHSLEKKWHGVDSIREADDLLLHGYRVSVDDKISVPFVETKGTQKVNAIGVVGYAPHVPNAINGLPLCMRYKKKMQVKNKVVDMYYNVSFSRGVSHKQMKQKGERMIAMITEHERKGVRVNLWVVASVTNGDDNSHTIIVRFKDAKHPLNIGRLYYPLLHPSFLRVQLFRVWAITTKVQDNMLYPFHNLSSILKIDGEKSILI